MNKERMIKIKQRVEAKTKMYNSFNALIEQTDRMNRHRANRDAYYGKRFYGNWGWVEYTRYDNSILGADPVYSFLQSEMHSGNLDEYVERYREMMQARSMDQKTYEAILNGTEPNLRNYKKPTKKTLLDRLLGEKI